MIPPAQGAHPPDSVHCAVRGDATPAEGDLGGEAHPATASVTARTARNRGRSILLTRGMPDASRQSISLRASFARAAPIAVLTSFASSGGGNTAGIPSDSIQSSRVHPVVW